MRGQKVKFTAGGPGKAPTVEFDYKAPEAAFAMYAIATWPNDPARQRQWIAIQQAVLVEKLRKPPEHLRQADLARYRDAADPTGDISEALAKESRNFLIARALERLDAVGGNETVINAPARDTLVAEVEKVSAAGARRAGELLLIVACMAEHHKDLPPSLNRAMAVIEARFKKAGKPTVTGTNERALKDAWRDYRAVAPLWAALIYREHVTAGKNFAAGSAFSDLSQRYFILSWAIWFRDFAASFRPMRSQEFLIEKEDMLDYCVGTEAIQPTLMPIPDRLLTVAKNYRVKAVKQDY